MKKIMLLTVLLALSFNVHAKNNNELKKVQKCESQSDQDLLKKNPGQYFFRIALLCNYEKINSQVSFDETIKILEKSAGYQYVPAYVLIGYLYVNKYESGGQLYNAKGTKEDLIKAIKNLETAASMGSVTAQNKLGEIYLDYANIPKQEKNKDIPNQNALIQLPDVKKAVHWLTLASENGHPAAQGTLSDLYKQGIGVIKNHILAYAWQNACIASQSKYNRQVASDEKRNDFLKSFSDTRDEIYNLLTDEQKKEAPTLNETFEKYIKKPSDIDSITSDFVSYISITDAVKLIELIKTSAPVEVEKDGIEKIYYDSGKLRAEIPYKNGKINGVEKDYYENGKLEIEATYKNGKLNGIKKDYYENGNLQMEVSVENDQLNGISKDYYEDGKLKSSVSYKNGKKDGKKETYYANGNLETEMSFKNGIMDGALYTYYENGELKAIFSVKNNILDGTSYFYDENGKLTEDQVFKNDKKNGISHEYYKSGKLKGDYIFKDGKLDGITHTYYESGRLESEVTFKNGIGEGVSREYYESGKLKTDQTVKNGKIEGIAREYYENGALHREQFFTTGIMISSLAYLEDGKLCWQVKYQNKKPISGINSKGQKLTNAELLNLQNGLAVNCK